MKTILIFLIISLFTICCRSTKSNGENQIKTFSLKELPKTTTVKLSDLGFVEVEYIPLITTEQCMIRRIMDIKVSYGYFLTQFFTTIFKFRTDGSFVTKLGTEGRGPNEFTVVHDVDIDINNKKIYLVSAWQRKFFVYSENGEFIRSFQSPLNTSNFKVTDNGILCYSINSFANVETSYNLIDTTGKIVKQFPNKYPWHLTSRNTYVFQYENLFYRFKNSLFKKEVYSDTIYKFENMTFKPHLVIEHGKRRITPKERSESSPEYIRDNYIAPMNLFEFGDYVYYEFIINGKLVSFICSKKNSFQALIDPERGILNDLDGGPNIWPKTIKDDNKIIGWIDASQLKAHVASEAFKNSTPKSPEKKKELEILADSLKETDNPVLMLVRLKK